MYGTIAGTVTDSSGAAIGNTTVTLTNLDKNEKRNITTDASGQLYVRKYFAGPLQD